MSNDFLYIDAHGYVWRLDLETAQAVENYNGFGEVQYTSSDCSGTAYVTAFPARYPFLLPGETALRVRRDTQTSESLAIRSSMSTSGCRTRDSGTVVVVPLDSTVPDEPIVRPVLDLVPPLHIERP